MAKVEVRVGKIWADNDYRDRNRRLLIIAVGEKKAEVECWTSHFKNRAIRLDRFGIGYRLVKDVAE